MSGLRDRRYQFFKDPKYHKSTDSPEFFIGDGTYSLVISWESPWKVSDNPQKIILDMYDMDMIKLKQKYIVERTTDGYDYVHLVGTLQYVDENREWIAGHINALFEEKSRYRIDIGLPYDSVDASEALKDEGG